MRGIDFQLLGAAADDDGLVASVSPGGAGNHTLLAAAASISPPRRAMLTVAADESTRTFTITGVDRYGHPRVESISGPAAAGAGYSTWEYQSISNIAVSGATTGAIRWGWDNVFYSQWIPLDDYRTPFNLAFGVKVYGTVNYTIQHCRQNDIRRNGALGHNDADLMVSDHPSVVSKTVDAEGNYSYPVSAIRVKLNSVNAGDGVRVRAKQAWF